MDTARQLFFYLSLLVHSFQADGLKGLNQRRKKKKTAVNLLSISISLFHSKVKEWIRREGNEKEGWKKAG